VPDRTPLRLTGARLVDGTGAPPVEDAVLISTADGRIAYAGPAAGAPPSPEASVRHLPGTTVLPGFVDTHVHLGMQVSDGPFHALVTDPALVTLETAARMRATLAAGVTTARDLAGASTGYREAVRRGLAEGPRLQVAIRMISHTGGHGDHAHPGGEVHTHLPALGEIADSAEQARLATRRLLREGADLIKIATTGGMGSPHDSPDDEGLRIDEVRAVVDELARHGGGRVAAHAQGTAGIRTALLGGVTSIEHGYGVDEEALDLLEERRAFLVPTLSTVFLGIDKERMQPYHYEKKMRWSEITQHNIARAIERKARIALGTDAGVGPHGRNLAELGFLVDLGMSPMNAIVAGTRTGAELLGLSDRIGTLEAGKTADVVVAGVDPLTDVHALGDPANVVFVVQDGRVVKDLLAGPDQQVR
jgi:imidazolonepropionase-like amidohydrolase